MGPFGHWYVLVLILAIVLIVWGPGKLPEVGGAIGRAMREFRKASTDLTEEIRNSASTSTTPPAVQQPQTSSDVKPTAEPKA